MNNKKSSMTSIKLPKLTSSGSRSPSKQNKRAYSEENPDKISAQAYGIYDTAMNPIICRILLIKNTIQTFDVR
jgi:hypothetical protein